MEKHNFAAYKAGTFSTDISNLTIVDGVFESKDMPAFIHEYCHYIQDITTLSSIFGFSLWLRDLVALTKITAEGTGKTISIPLPKDEYGETVNKNRKFYNLYCGDSDDVFELDYELNRFASRQLEFFDVDLDGKTQKFAVNEIELLNRPSKLFFGLIALQEIHAFYAQKLAERRFSGIELSVYADHLPSFPYKFGDFLFSHYQINLDLDSKFVLVDLCLDTVQAPTVFLDVLELLQGKSLSYCGAERTDFFSIVNECNKQISYSKEEVMANILPDLEILSADTSREYFAEAVGWYHKQLKFVLEIKEVGNPLFFSMPFCAGSQDFNTLFNLFPSPVYINNGAFYGNVPFIPEHGDIDFDKNFKAATTFWSHRVLYDLLCAESQAQIKERCHCPLYENCDVREKIDDDYTCKMAPWEIVRNDKKISCQYGIAAHSFGLMQNSLNLLPTAP